MGRYEFLEHEVPKSNSYVLWQAGCDQHFFEGAHKLKHWCIPSPSRRAMYAQQPKVWTPCHTVIVAAVLVVAA